MRLLDRHVGAEWAKALGLALGATLGLLLVAAVFNDLQEFIALRRPAGEAAAYFAALLPGFLPTVLPFSVLLSVLLTVGRLRRQNEWVAMRAAGLSVGRAAAPLLAGGLLATAALVLLNASWVPWSAEAARAILLEARAAGAAGRGADAGEARLARRVAHRDAASGRLWFLETLDEATGEATGVTVEVPARPGVPGRAVAAARAAYRPGAGWTFHEARETTFEYGRGEAVRSVHHPALARPQWGEAPWLMAALRQKPRDLGLAEVARVRPLLDPATPAGRAFATQFHRVWASSLQCLVAVLLAVPLAAAGGRGGEAAAAARAVLAYLLYLVAGMGAGVLGDAGLLPPPAAAWLPHAAALALAGVWWARLR